MVSAAVVVVVGVIGLSNASLFFGRSIKRGSRVNDDVSAHPLCVASLQATVVYERIDAIQASL